MIIISEIELLINEIRQVSPLITDDELSEFISGVEIHNIPIKTIYINRGEIQNSIGYVTNGLIRAYYIDDKGKEINVAFIKKGFIAGHYSAFANQKPSKYFFETIEDSLIIGIPYYHLYKCCEKFHTIEHFYCMMLRRELCHKQERIDSFIFDNAETRYMNFLKSNPDLNNRITVTMLSSYLGIERQTLTRIRKKILYDHNDTNVSL